MPPVYVLAHFADDATRVYQLVQWLPVLERLHEVHPVGIVTRDVEVAGLVRARTTLPVLCVPSFQELTELYDRLDAKVVLYCNNSALNFNSLLHPRMLHVHINHGESDKQSMASNNAKAYDRVFVAGEAAVQRHAATLLDFDLTKLVRTGRPQLDIRSAPLLTPSPRRTVLYAPTWEGDADYNDYTSIDLLGVRIAEAIRAVPDVRLVYKPHPKVVTSTRPAVRDAHLEVLALADVAVTEGDILRVMPDCDAMVTDVSSVGLDWLYLRTERPIFITDRHGNLERLRDEVPVSRCADIVDETTVDGLTGLLTDRLEHDDLHLARIAMRHHYFDGLAVGESTQRFTEAVTEVVRRRDRLLGYASAITA